MISYTSKFLEKPIPLYTAFKNRNIIIDDEKYLLISLNDIYSAIVFKSHYLSLKGTSEKIEIEFDQPEKSLFSKDKNILLVQNKDKVIENLMKESNAGYKDCKKALETEDPIKYLKDNHLYLEIRKVKLEVTFSIEEDLFLDEMSFEEALSDHIYTLTHYREDLFAAIENAKLKNIIEVSE